MPRGAGSATLFSKGRHLAALYVWSFLEGYRRRKTLRGVERCCLFIGHPRSGHSLVGSLLDSHPDVVIAHELDLVGLLKRFSRNQIFALVLRRDRMFTDAGSTQARTGYDFSVPGQWQGRVRRLRVVGAKKGPRTAERLHRDPELIEQVRRKLAADLRVIHVLRNPYDNISTIAGRVGITLESAIEDYFRLCERLHEVRSNLADDELCTLRHEDFVKEAAVHLSELCMWLGVEPTEEYLRDAASVVFDEPRRTRSAAAWTPELVARVDREMQGFDFLEGYSFDS